MSAKQSQAIWTPPAWMVDPARVRRIAVVCGAYALHVFDQIEPQQGTPAWRRVHVPEWAALGHLIELALAEGCAALWLLPARGAAPSAADSWPIRHWTHAAQEVLTACRAGERDYTAHELTGAHNQLAGLIIQGKSRGQRIPMGVYAVWAGDLWNVCGQLAQLPAQETVRAVHFADAVLHAAHWLGAQLRFSPSYTGLAVLRQTLAHKVAAGVELAPLSPWAEELVSTHRPTYVHWQRPITPEEWAEAADGADGLVLRKYDRNSSFVASAGEVPVGDPLPIDQFMPGCPGFYRLTAMPFPGTHWPAGTLPGPFRAGAQGSAGTYPAAFTGWAWEPQIRLALREGWRVDVHHGYYWPRSQKHDLFRVWRERIWRARGQAESYGGAAGGLAKAIIKRTGVATIGRVSQHEGRAVMGAQDALDQGLALESLDVDVEGELTGLATVRTLLGRRDLVQPHWWSTIIANANERLFAALYAHVEAAPLAAYVDAVYCLHPWPVADLSPQLGKWKLERVTGVTRAQVETLNAAGTAATWVKVLAHIDRELVGGDGAMAEDE